MLGKGGRARVDCAGPSRDGHRLWGRGLGGGTWGGEGGLAGLYRALPASGGGCHMRTITEKKIPTQGTWAQQEPPW